MTASRTQTVVQVQGGQSSSSAAATSAGVAAAEATASAQSAGSSTSTPAWVWWLVGALVVVGLIAGGIALARQHDRKRDWDDEFTAATQSVARLAGQLIPSLRAMSEPQQMASTWRVEERRVVLLEQRLANLQTRAKDDDQRRRAATLREAVGSARQQFGLLTGTTDPAAADELVQAVGVELDAAVALARPADQTG